MGQNDVERYNLLPPREFYSAMPAFICISLVIQQTNYKRLVAVVYFRERLSSTTSAWSPWIFSNELHPFYLVWKWVPWQSGKVVQVFFLNAFNFRNTQTVFTNAVILEILFSFASLSRIENISIISRRDKKHNKLWREPPAMIKNNKARGKAEKAKYQY